MVTQVRTEVDPLLTSVNVAPRYYGYGGYVAPVNTQTVIQGPTQVALDANCVTECNVEDTLRRSKQLTNALNNQRTLLNSQVAYTGYTGAYTGAYGYGGYGLNRSYVPQVVAPQVVTQQVVAPQVVQNTVPLRSSLMTSGYVAPMVNVNAGAYGYPYTTGYTGLTGSTALNNYVLRRSQQAVVRQVPT